MLRTTLLLSVLLVCQFVAAQPWQQDNSVFNPSGIPSLTFSQPRFADLDGDGDQDFLLGSTNSAPIYIKNTGSITVPAFTPGENITSGISFLAAEMGVCVDIDDDGDLDLITGGYTGLHLFLNSGTVNLPSFSEVNGFFTGLNVGSNPVPDLADIDGDNDYDLVVGLSESGSVLLYTNLGTPTAAQFSQASMQVLGDVGLYAYPVFCDLDGDNDQDILVGRDSHGFIFYQNVGTSTAAVWQENSSLFAGLGVADYWNSPDLVDLNNDGLYDLIHGTASGPLQYYVNIGTAAAPVWQANTSLFGGVLDVGGASSPVFYDFDGDGDLDMISGSQMGDIKYYQNTGTAHAPAWLQNNAYFASIDHSIYAAVAIGDVDLDGLPDAIIGDLSGNLYFHRNTGMGFVQQAGVLPAATFGGWSVPRLVDMDNDDDLDLVVGNEAGNLRYFENQGTSSTPNWTELTGYFPGIDVGSSCVPSFGDIDNDGDLDFVAGNLVGNIRCYLKEGLGWQLNSTLFSGITTDQNAAPALVDLDLDGDLDLVVGDYDGTFSYHRNLLYSGATLNPPQNLEVSSTDVALFTWTAPAAGSTSPFVGYKIYLDGDFYGATTSQSLTLSDIQPGTHTLAVTAQYIAGESLPIAIDWTAYSHNPPQNAAYEQVAEHIVLTWTAPEDSGLPVQNYRVYLDSALYAETSELSCVLNGPFQPGVTQVVHITAVYNDGVESEPAILQIIFTAGDDGLQTPLLLQNSPNPAKPFTTISFQLKAPSAVRLEIFNTRGQLILNLVQGELAAGTYSRIWDGRDSYGKSVASGVFFYRLTLDKEVLTRRLLLVK